MSSTDQTPDRARAEQAQAGDYDLSLFGDNHVEAYEQSNGAVGYIWNGAPIAILTTTGAKSGKVRKHALIYGTDGDDVLLIASQGGAPDNPLWYKNLDADPKVAIQILAERFEGRARTASSEEKARLWPGMTDIWPAYDDYQAATERDIPLVVIERVPQGS